MIRINFGLGREKMISIDKLNKKRIKNGGYLDLNQFVNLKENSYVYGSNARFWFKFDDFIYSSKWL